MAGQARFFHGNVATSYGPLLQLHGLHTHLHVARDPPDIAILNTHSLMADFSLTPGFSLGSDLLDVLRTDEEDLLNFPSLEWALDDALGAHGKGDGDASSFNLQLNHSEQYPAALASMESGVETNTTLPSPNTPLPLPIPNMDLLAAGWNLQGVQLPLPKPEPTSSGETAEALLGSSGAPQPPARHQAPPRRASARAVSSHSMDQDESHGPAPDSPRGKKKRTRNAEQMEQNRLAQQKYRERKKAEHEQLQNALEQLTAQLAAVKAMEIKTASLEAQNQSLSSTVAAQAQRIAELNIKVETQAQELQTAQQSAAQATALVTQQQSMILDQHTRMKLQEEVIETLRGQLRNKIEEAIEGQDAKTVCQRLTAAVKGALMGAKNVEGLQEALEALPEDVLSNICKSIVCEVKSMWPELAARMHELKMCGPHTCSQQVWT